MRFSVACVSLVVAVASFVAGSPIESNLAKRETSFGNPDLVVDQGNQYKLNFGSPEGHENACPGHFICYIGKNGDAHGDVSLGDPDDMVDEGDRYRLNYGSTSGHPNACDGHFM
ncbi:hypothetical protein FRC07_004460 [Ceratobasidium sp. 392]|nr:hypothetical protein FRC07_004460 [Ceratobasidium sp. 392]